MEMEKLLSVVERKMIEDLLKTDDELKAFYKQLNDHNNAQKTLDKGMKDAKNKKIHKFVIPWLAGIMIEKRADDKETIEMFKKQQGVFDNTIKGIKGQITHRNDIWNENIIKIVDALVENLKDRGMDPRKTRLMRRFEEKPLVGIIKPEVKK